MPFKASEMIFPALSQSGFFTGLMSLSAASFCHFFDLLAGIARHTSTNSLTGPSYGSLPSIASAARIFTIAPKLRCLGGVKENLPLLRSEEHTSELQSLMRITYAVFCLKKKKEQN